MATLQERCTTLWRAATSTERQALAEHVEAPLPAYLHGLLATHGIPAAGSPPGRPPALVMPPGLVAYIEQQVTSVPAAGRLDPYP